MHYPTINRSFGLAPTSAYTHHTYKIQKATLNSNYTINNKYVNIKQYSTYTDRSN